jgi:Leucine-rich repeat (LRR) protein
MRECILLTTLKLGSNSFSHFPDVLLKMNLIELEIDHNFLTELPLEIGTLHTLSIFICCNNRLAALPPTFPELKSMKQFDIRDNAIINISLEILRMPIMAVLTIWGNPCEHVKRIESGDLDGLPDEWRVALPQILAAGNPPRTSTKSTK